MKFTKRFDCYQVALLYCSIWLTIIFGLHDIYGASYAVVAAMVIGFVVAQGMAACEYKDDYKQ